MLKYVLKIKRMFEGGAYKLAQQEEQLLHKHRDLSSDPQHTRRKLILEGCAFNPSSGETEFQELSSKLTQPIGRFQFQ